jgi:microcompartment protein CcmK/EutM
MQIARVVGNAVASVKEPRLTGTTLLLVEDAAADGASLGGAAYVAVDLVGAGEPELVLVVRGSSAARAVGVDGAPIDAAVVAILDQVRAGGRSTYEKR